MSDWLDRLLVSQPGSERELVERYTLRLMEFARRQLPERVQRRVDPEDVVQSVYRSFFRRLKEGQFNFEESQDVWRLLAAMTFCKARNVVKFHQRGRRDVRRDAGLQPFHAATESHGLCDPEPGAEDVALMLDCLEQLLAKLPDNYRQIVVHRLEGDSIEEIAHKVNRTRRTVLRVLAHVQELGSSQLEAGL